MVALGGLICSFLGLVLATGLVVVVLLVWPGRKGYPKRSVSDIWSRISPGEALDEIASRLKSMGFEVGHGRNGELSAHRKQSVFEDGGIEVVEADSFPITVSVRAEPTVNDVALSIKVRCVTFILLDSGETAYLERFCEALVQQSSFQAPSKKVDHLASIWMVLCASVALNMLLAVSLFSPIWERIEAWIPLAFHTVGMMGFWCAAIGRSTEQMALRNPDRFRRVNIAPLLSFFTLLAGIAVQFRWGQSEWLWTIAYAFVPFIANGMVDAMVREADREKQLKRQAS
ncbi:MAG: hypothetical protein ACQKBV_13735 [Puniceicoccales bacterium]